ncbi:PREDICTED: uncharacterized protein LOC109214986 [Nicotiana attenuata]|uniref:Protein embryonic flower 1 n=1 Tax=Nicotiana attenuata TaxID=49451 RepID=A0A1J6KYI2_NICAT|nr:PREDICTED: uncharacterized protein LOC109214986 [Nicotiana attenuata]OIT26687.1 protein embryonic flower 1 [Nicotiana attenuata]
MEKSAPSVEGSDSDTCVSKSSGSQLLPIGGISIDLNLPMPVKEKENCHHFSIRGYVAEMRKKDMKICSPFGSSSKPEDQLPPIDIPKFKSWRCKKCISEVGAEGAGDEMCVHKASTSGVQYLLPEMKHVSDSRKGDKNKAIMEDYIDTDDNDYILSWKRSKEKWTVVQNTTVKAVPRSVREEETGNPATEQCSTQETKTKSPAANTKIADSESNDESDEEVPYDIDPEIEIGSQNVDQKTPSITSDEIEVLGSQERVLNMSNVNLNRSPSVELIEGTETSKGSDENLAVNSQCDLHEDIANDIPRRKTRKLRLLAEILLGENANLEMNCANAERCSANTMPIVLSDEDTVGAPKDKVSFLKDARKGNKTSQKKRRTSQEDNRKSEMNLDGKMAKRSKAFNKKAERRSSMEIEVSDSRAIENGSVKERPQSRSKSAKIKHRSDHKDSRVNKKKHKKDQLVSGSSPQMLPEGKSTGISTNGYDGANILFQSSNASTAEEVETHLRNESLHGKERNSDLCLLEVRNASSPMNVAQDKNLQRESSRNDVVQMPTGMGVVTSQLENELSANAKLDLSLSRSKDAEKRVENDIIQSKNRTNWQLSLQNSSKSCDPKDNSFMRQSNVSESGQSLRKGVNALVRQSNVSELGQSSGKEVNSLVRQLNVPGSGQSLWKGVNSLVRQSNVSESGQSSRKGVICDLNQGMYQTSSVWQQIQISPDPLQRGNIQMPNRMETPQPCRNANLNGVQGSSSVIKLHRSHQSKKVVEKRPIEIVELLNNNHERSLPLTRSNLVIERNDNGAVTWLNPSLTGFHPVHANVNADVGVCRGYIPHLSNGKVNSAEMTQVQEPQFKLFGNLKQSQQKPSNGGQVSAPVPIRWGSQHGEGSKPGGFPTRQQSILFGQKYLHPKGRTISDIKSMDSESQSKWHQTSNPYSSETIPALQLLGRVDQTTPLPPAFNVVQQQSFSACNYPPRIYMDGNQSVHDGSFLSRHHPKESSGVRIGGYTAGNSSQQPFTYLNDQVSHAPVQLGGRNLQQSVCSSGLWRSTREVVGTSSSMVHSLQTENASRSLDSSTPITTVLPVSIIPKKNPPCLLNQNPAEIALADNEKYLRTAEDQDIRNKSSSREKSGAVRMDGRKQQRKKNRPGRMPLECRRAP